LPLLRADDARDPRATGLAPCAPGAVRAAGMVAGERDAARSAAERGTGTLMLAAASDLLLAFACMAAIAIRAGGASRAGRTAMLGGWCVLAVTALAGAWRYAFAPEIAGTHRLLSDLAAGIGMPAVVLGLLLGWRA